MAKKRDRKEYMRNYWATHPGFRARKRQYYKRNKEHFAQWRREYYVKNKAVIAERSREDRRKHPEKYREKSRLRRKKLRDEIFMAYGGYACACCGETEPMFLTIDHINNGGTKHRKDIGGAEYFYTWLRQSNYPKGYQILCYNCNCGKARNNGICPHEVKEARYGKVV